jgi:type II secretory pathway component PulF
MLQARAQHARAQHLSDARRLVVVVEVMVLLFMPVFILVVVLVFLY